MKYIGSIIVAFLATSVWWAALEADTGLPGPSIGSDDDSVTNFLEFAVTMLQDITAIAAVLGICLVGIMYIMSHGDEEKTESAKKYIIAILIGVILSVAAWGMIALIDAIPNSLQF